MLKAITATATKCRHPRITTASPFDLCNDTDTGSHVYMLIINVNMRHSDIQIRGCLFFACEVGLNSNNMHTWFLDSRWVKSEHSVCGIYINVAMFLLTYIAGCPSCTFYIIVTKLWLFTTFFRLVARVKINVGVSLNESAACEQTTYAVWTQRPYLKRMQ